MDASAQVEERDGETICREDLCYPYHEEAMNYVRTMMEPRTMNETMGCIDAASN
jgi:hypothetical protein